MNRRRLAALGVLAMMTLGAMSAAVDAAVTSGPVDAGDVVVVAEVDGDEPIGGGGSATPFSLRLPADASCPGDSANDGWLVESFMVPATDDPATLHFDGFGPVGEGSHPLYNDNSNPHTQVLLQANTAAGERGLILPTPLLSFAVFGPAMIEPGRYRIGIACRLYEQVGDYWDTEIVVESDATDSPGGLRWSTGQPGTTLVTTGPADDTAAGRDSSTGRNVVLVVGALLAGVAAILIGARRRALTMHKTSPKVGAT